MHILIRTLTIEDYEPLKSVMIKSYSAIGGQYWRQERIQKLIQIFPEGQLCAEVDGQLVGCALSILVDVAAFADAHTYRDVTDEYTFNTHTPSGRMLYGIDVFVDPVFRGIGLGRRLYDERKKRCIDLNLAGIRAGGRLPHFSRHASELTPAQYVDRVRSHELYDPTLSFQLANGFRVKQIIKNYLLGDTESQEYATLIEWVNPAYNPHNTRSHQPPVTRLVGGNTPFLTQHASAASPIVEPTPDTI